jgi:hypothetical protein
MSTKGSLKNHLDALVRKHRSLDEQIASLHKTNAVDNLELGSLKREKLYLKEEIIQTEQKLEELENNS